jgi:glycogen synthase
MPQSRPGPNGGRARTTVDTAKFAIVDESRAIRVALVCARYLPFVGGIELHVHEVAKRLAAAGADVTIVTTDPGARLPREELGAVRVRRARAWPANRDYYFAPGIDRELRDGAFDVVHVQGYQTFVAPVALRATRRLGVPTVLTFHGGGHSSRLRQAIRPLQLRGLRPLVQHVRTFVALAEFEIAQYAPRLHVDTDRFVVIPNGSDLPPAAAQDVPRDRSLLASLGRLERYKGHHRVIAALPHVLARRADARLWIGGVGPEEDALRSLAAELGVAERVEIRGVPPQDREQMARELARVDTVVSLSDFETQPIAALEALSLGCKLVVADSPGLDALAASGLATSVPLDASPPDVGAAILDALESPPLREPPPLPSWDDCAAALLGVYREIVAKS